MVSLVPRTGRQFQRYNQGRRQVVGCIPCRFRKTNLAPSLHGNLIEELEVLMISSQKSSRLMFPKGGWETDETMDQAAKRETLEEAGVLGFVGPKLGRWSFESKSQGTIHEGHMFPLLVIEELDDWPEKNFRQRKWMSVKEARDVCVHLWMKQALDEFVVRLMQQQKEGESLTAWTVEFWRSEEMRLNVVPQSGEDDAASVFFGQLKQQQREGESLTACAVEFRRAEGLGIVPQSGEEDTALLPW